PGVSGVSRGRAPAVCESRRARVREGARLLRRPLGIRAADVRARGGRKRARDRGVHARLLPPGATPLRRDHRDETVARHPQEPQAAEAARAVPRRPDQALLPARPRAPRPAFPPRPRQLSARMGGHQQIRVLKDLDLDVRGRDVLIVEDVVDTGLTLNYLVRTLDLRGPASVAAVTLLDRPYRRLVEDLPVRYVGFDVPDELFVGYGFDLQERYRNLPDLHVLES